MGPKPEVDPSRSEAGRSGSSSTHLPPEPKSARQARQFVVGALRQAGYLDDDLLYRLALVTSELVTNAILHARTDIEVRVGVAGHLIDVEVLDGNTNRIRRVTPRPVDAGGRGLMLVEALVDDWGVAELDHERDDTKAKKVWVRVVSS